MDTVVAFTREYSKVSISTGNEKCFEPELIRLRDMVTKDRKARVDFRREGIADEVWDS
jgi:hypothetical protein